MRKNNGLRDTAAPHAVDRATHAKKGKRKNVAQNPQAAPFLLERLLVMLSRRDQHRLFINLLDVHESKLTARIARARNKFIKAAASEYLTHDGDTFHDAYIALVEEMNAILTAHYESIIPKAGRIAMRGVKSLAKMEQKAEPSLFGRIAQQWITDHALRNARLASSTTRREVRDVIQSGVDEGLGSIEVARNISKATMLSRYRAEVISRTETHNAATFGSIESVRIGAEEVGVKILKFWIPVLDERTRESHAEMSGEPGIALDDKFYVGGEYMDRPGDPAGGAANVINCRCGITYSEDES